jgi:hypothetical protein
VEARQVAVSVKLNDLLSQMEVTAPSVPSTENPLLVSPGDTQRKTTVPAKTKAKP